MIESVEGRSQYSYPSAIHLPVLLPTEQNKIHKQRVSVVVFQRFTRWDQETERLLQKIRSSSFWDVSRRTTVGSDGLFGERYLQMGPIRWSAMSAITDQRCDTPLKSEGLI